MKQNSETSASKRIRGGSNNGFSKLHYNEKDFNGIKPKILSYMYDCKIENIFSNIENEVKTLEKVTDNTNNTNRLIHAAAELYVANKIFLGYGVKTGHLDKNTAESLKNDYRKYLIERVNVQAIEGDNLSNGSIFINTMRELISSGKAIIPDAAEAFNNSYSNTTVLGVRDNDFYYIYPSLSVDMVRKTLGNSNASVRLTEKNVSVSLKTDGILSGQKAKEKQFNGKKSNYWWIKKEVFESENATAIRQIKRLHKDYERDSLFKFVEKHKNKGV